MAENTTGNKQDNSVTGSDSANSDYFQKLQELAKAYNERQKTCPSCGHCPTCGRGGYWSRPYYPYQPYVWYGTTTTGGSLTQISTTGQFTLQDKTSETT